MSLPLEGCTVVAIDQAIAAPLAARNLADLGARVIKVERADTGDLARSYDHVVHGTAAHFVWLNRGKESVALDLTDPDCLAAVRTLIGRADVFLQNLAPGAAERLGLGAEVLQANNPGLVVVNMTGYGGGGPFAHRKAYDLLVQAEVGLVSITGTRDHAVKTGIATADIASGMYCSQAVLAALLRRQRTGKGAVIDVNMFEATAEWMGYPMYVQMYADRQIPRLGLSHAAIAPYDAYPTADGEVVIGIQTDRGWRTLVTEVFGRADLADDPRFRTNILRVENRFACDAEVAAHTRAWTTTELNARLAEVGVPAARVNSVRGLVEHPQLKARKRWRLVETENGSAEALLPPATFSDVEAPMGPVPALGQHTVDVLREAGLDDNLIDRLLAAGTAVQHQRTESVIA
jgi:crotonobetainyl-CoA:carnitine CoA-transferase CaiB-like acyl-CoA transferase